MSLMQLTQQSVLFLKQQVLGAFETKPDFGPRVNQPILSETEVLNLAEELSGLVTHISPNLKQSVALRQGEQASRFMGAGLEYEESRPYQMGDEIRRINWRLMARTGKAYTKLFQEERQANWLILVDHRQSMRFGTRTRLKAAQATRVAGYFAWQAQQSMIPVVGARLSSQWLLSPMVQGRVTFMQLMNLFAVPCPPLAQTRFEPRLNDVLIELSPQIQAGTRLIIISDFHDVDAQTTEILLALQQQATVTAVWVMDQAEKALPDIEGLLLQSSLTGQVNQINTPQQRQQYQAWSDSYQQKIRQTLVASGLQLNSVMADDSLTAMQAAFGRTYGR